ncbi:hypothetical protein FZI85_28400 [Mycobacterium sp. CBMA293]|uniref:hypothetical protein n=1 Tax=unclassified Mycolicibacterium TaxID=2636767 RepID=UPI0012DFD05C|nr:MULTISPECIES: hypothetical protein [unclassified Mycolicibacterium]MUL45648.1 hypothetical protein [Mycolicibacterium sp. CBMA 360]MUL60318.1 hypothetical protein [Mycolicibacterium sp. CBMA 335]MUL71470.1 hypothetical protein [Mycolicibacterium sp. CBMA 311]MUL73105.1 hypothetical protein [Mycolicibacterium sp. CBMA 311]MUL95920.1 hypothetical protein [Mycolicibacterium sp. CBMA 230]
MFTTTVKKMIITGLFAGSATLAGLGLATGTASAFNPQPEPPGLTQAHGSGGGAGKQFGQKYDGESQHRGGQPLNGGPIDAG